MAGRERWGEGGAAGRELALAEAGLAQQRPEQRPRQNSRPEAAPASPTAGALGAVQHGAC